MSVFTGLALRSADVADAIVAGTFSFPPVAARFERESSGRYRVTVRPTVGSSVRLASFVTDDAADVAAAEAAAAEMNADLERSWCHLAAAHFDRRVEAALSDARTARERAGRAFAQGTRAAKMAAQPSRSSASAGIDLMRELGFSDEDAREARNRAAAEEPTDEVVIAALYAYGYTENDLHHRPGERMRAALRAAAGVGR